MSDEEMVDALAERMYGAAFEMSGMLRDKAWKARTDRALYRRLARECLRQMEWARRHSITGNTLIEHNSSGAIYATKIDQPLTVAPDDWKPE